MAERLRFGKLQFVLRRIAEAGCSGGHVLRVIFRARRYSNFV